MKHYLKKIEWRVATTLFENGTDIYYEEYIKRYGKITNNYSLVSLNQLEQDIQMDFIYLDLILQENVLEKNILQILHYFYFAYPSLFLMI